MKKFLHHIYTALLYCWKKFSETLGLISGTLLPSIVYFVILLPLSLFRRLAGKNEISFRPGDNSFYKIRNHTYTKPDLENAW